jgi:hypothetical protein
MEQELIKATWGLVLVTGLLVIATLIPLITDILRRRDEKAAVATRAVPDMNILRSRLDGACERLARPTELSEDEVREQLHRTETDLEILHPIIEVREASLKFTNELFILRHLLTFAHDNLIQSVPLFSSVDPRSVRMRDEALRKAQRAYNAAVLTLDAAEDLLPRKQRTIDGERFWDRFSRVSDDRENQAAQNILAKNTVHRTQQRTS